jgi:hypothetical protein
MSKLVDKGKTILPIDEFLDKVGKTKEQLYQLVRERKWRNGFVLRKPKNGRVWQAGCYEEYLEWLSN